MLARVKVSSPEVLLCPVLSRQSTSIQIVAVAGNCQVFEKRRGESDTELRVTVVRKS